MYHTHPPYLEEVTIKVSSVFLDQTGHEDIQEEGEMIFTKDPDTNYWFQPSNDIDWYDLDEDINFDDNSICQR